MKRWFLILSACLASIPVYAQQVKFIDTRLLLLAHPIFRQFSAETGRFTGTVSEPVLDGEAGISRVQNELEAKKREYAALPASWSKRFSTSMTKAERALMEEAFIAEQHRIQNRMKILEERLVYLRGVPGRPGLTTNMSMSGQAATVARDIRAVVGRLRAGFNGLIMDIASLLPDCPPEIDTRLLYSNLNFGFWRAPFAPDGNTVLWLEQAKRYLFTNAGPLPPVVYGGLDARLESVRHLEQIAGGK